jgi:hypothetical protein
MLPRINGPELCASLLDLQHGGFDPPLCIALIAGAVVSPALAADADASASSFN